MVEYDPDALDSEADKSELKGSLTGTIVDIRQDVAHNIFGDKTQSDPDKEMLVVTVENDEVGEVESVFSLPESEQSWLNPLFKLQKFRSKYNQVPREGMEVELTATDSGFMDIDLPDRADIGE